ncbi:MAG: FAD-dependent oxidoreductase [Candidatus Delongbacteria bacterium]
MTTVVIGAGMTGLAAARQLSEAGQTVLVLDKGRGVGGRMASRRFGGAVFEHGANHLTARGPRFAALLRAWSGGGVVRPWRHGGAGEDRELLLWRGEPAMTAPAKQLAAGLDLRLEARVTALRRTAGGWSVELEDGPSVRAGAVLLTAPLPQSLALLAAGDVPLDPHLRLTLTDIDYEPGLVLMVRLDGPSRVPPPGLLEWDEGPLARLVDGQQKGVSTVPALTLQAGPAFSRQHLDGDREAAARELLSAAEPWLGGRVLEQQLHVWRYSRPVTIHDQPCVLLCESPPLLLAGDAFAGPRVEDAARSGWAAAARLLELGGAVRPD